MLNKIDHTLLKATTTENDILNHCDEAVEMGAYSVCVMPSMVDVAATYLTDYDVKVCSVVGFPLGATPAEVKAFEAKFAVQCGADEIDMVINIGEAKGGNFSYIDKEIALIKEAIGDVPLKVIIETSEFNEYEKYQLCEVVADSDAEYIKTSTGTTSKGATVEDVKMMVDVGMGQYLVKASGGVSNLETMKKMIEAGADRIGTSNGLRIKMELEGENVDNVKVENY